MGWRHAELSKFGSDVIPLFATDAITANRLARECLSQSRYGLNEAVFASIDRLNVEQPTAETRQWLAERVGNRKLVLVFAEDEVFQVPASLFLDCWQDMFCPSRDDVVILSVDGGWTLFYCHEDEFEFAQGGPAELGAAADRPRE